MEERNDRPAEEPRPQTAPEGTSPAEVAPPGPAESVAELRAQVARYREEAERNWQQFLHAAADLENYKKQAARARDDAVQRVRGSMLGVVLSVVDNLERALDHADNADASAILEGLRMTHREVVELLAKMGVRPMASKGKPFDPRLHEAIDVISHTELGVEPNTVVEELQRGYTLHGEVLRPARVRVAQ